MDVAQEHVIPTKRLTRALDRRHITGAAAIGQELGCSGNTIRRLYAKGRFREFIYRSGTNTSPLRMLRIHVPAAYAQLRENA
jgi:hypothetical protein